MMMAKKRLSKHLAPKNLFGQSKFNIIFMAQTRWWPHADGGYTVYLSHAAPRLETNVYS